MKVKSTLNTRLLTMLALGWLVCFGFQRPLMAQSSSNMTLLGNWDGSGIPMTSSNTQYSDLWGYAAGGREYAILGASHGTYFLDITIPSSPQVVCFQTNGSPNSIWRDYMTYQHYLYAVEDQGSTCRMQIFDLSGLPGTVTKVYDSPALFQKAHNIFIDEAKGRMYVCGSNTQPNGILILDIATNPTNPTLLANFVLGGYVHDVYVKDDTCFAFFGTAGALASFDFHDLNNPSMLSMIQFYPEQGYTHSGWASTNMDYLYWIDENHGTGVHIGDIRDPYEIRFHSTFRANLLGPSQPNNIAHNVYVKGNTLYVSYYHDGLQMWNISNPTSPAKIGHYDTHPQNTDYSGMDGAWGVYPFLPSGNILVSDTENGLFILRHNSAPLPVSISRFEANLKDGIVELDWHTASETNNEGFHIQRSADGTTFQDIDFLPGAGNSGQPLAYQAFDYNPLEGLSYYRIRQVDHDGSESFSEVRTINTKGTMELLSLYPVPAQAGQELALTLRMEKDELVTLSLTNTLGQQVWRKVTELPTGLHQMHVPTETLAAGTYIIKVATPTGTSTRRVVVNAQG